MFNNNSAEYKKVENNVTNITPVFNKTTDEKLERIITNRNKITDKMVTQILKNYTQFQLYDLNFIPHIKTEHLNKLNIAVQEIRKQGIYLSSFYLPFLAYNIIHTIKIIRLGVGIRKAMGVWSAFLISLPVMNILVIRKRELNFMKKLEDLLIEIEAQNDSNLDRKLLKNQLEFYKKEKYL